VVSEALDVARLTEGAFDITVAPLVNLWSFGPDKRPEGIPSEEEIAAALDVVDYRALEVRLEPPALRKQVPHLSIDLSGIAKGHAVDRIAVAMDARGVAGYLVEIGGEVRTKGGKLDGQPWRIGLEQPPTHRRAVPPVMTVRDGCLATSGDYRNFFEWGGTTYSHAIDPRTGWPVRHDLAAVSVMGPSVTVADAMATGLMILSPKEAWQLAQRSGLEVQLVIRQHDRYRTLATPGFPRFDNAAAK
jgi:thiamine biosynthesis lipoprotein